MQMQIQGKIIQINPIQTGESPRGAWKKREFIVETYAKFPKKVCAVIKGDLVDSIQLNQGDSVKVSIDIESREFKDRWYTEVRAWKVEPATEDGDSSSSYSEESPF